MRGTINRRAMLGSGTALSGDGLIPLNARKTSSVPADVPYPTYPFTRMATLTRKASVNGGAGIAAISDVTSDGVDAIRVVAPTTDVVLVPAAPLATPINMTSGGSIRIGFKGIASLNTLSRFVLELFSGASVTTANFVRTNQFGTQSDLVLRSTGGIPAQPAAGVYQYYSVALSMFIETAGTGADLSAITGFRLRLRSSGGAATLEGVTVDYVPNPASKAKCIIFFDDGDASQYSHAFPALQALGFPAVLYPSPYQSVFGTGGKYTKAQALEMQAAGWQIASQAWDSEDHVAVAAAGLTALETSFDALRAAQRADGFYAGSDGSLFASIGNYINVRPAFYSKFRTCRGFFLGNAPGVGQSPMAHGETFPLGDPYYIRAISGATGAWGATMGAYLTALIDQAIAAKGVAMIGYHEELASAGNARTGFATLLSYLDANRANIEVVTLKGMLG